MSAARVPPQGAHMAVSGCPRVLLVAKLLGGLAGIGVAPAAVVASGIVFASIVFAIGIVVGSGVVTGNGPLSEGISRVPTGVIVGVVRLGGDVLPEPTQVQNTTDPEICGEVQSRQDLRVSAATRGVRDVIVAVTGLSPSEVPPAPPGHLVLDNRDCQFAPHAAVLTVGSSIEAVSHDPVLHTVHFYGPVERNIALPQPGLSETVTVDAPGRITVLCDVHGWMRAFIRVDAHPLHAVSDAEGRFRIAGVPPGAHELELWHERLGSRSRSVRVESGVTTEIEVTYSPEAP